MRAADQYLAAVDRAVAAAQSGRDHMIELLRVPLRAHQEAAAELRHRRAADVGNTDQQQTQETQE